MRHCLFILITIFSLASSPASACDCAKPLEGTYLTLIATETVEVKNDLLTAVLRVEKEGEDEKFVQNSINEDMARALEAAKKISTITISTEQYYIYRYEQEQNTEDKKKTPAKKMWRGAQVLSLKSTTSKELLKLVGELQNLGLLMQNLSYSLSTDKKEVVRDSLMESALAKLTRRGMKAAKSLDKKYGGFTWISIDPATYPPTNPSPLMGLANSSQAKMTTPSAEPGISEVTMNVNGTVLLK